MNRRNKIILSQFKKITERKDTYIKYLIRDVNEWYIKIYGFDGDNNEFADGEYIAKLTIPEEFPYKPPSFAMMTPNGVYDMGGPICISVGEFHSQNYLPVLGIGGFAYQLLSGFIGWKSLGSGIRLLDTTIEKKKQFAINSKIYNQKHLKEIDDAIDAAYENYSKTW